MRYAVFLFILASFLLFVPMSYANSKWFYPMTKIEKRATVKGFGMYIDENFYKTHSLDFPNHFYGFHAAQDLETLPNEKSDSADVPVYFVTSGTISYIGNLSGYGGVILVRLDQTGDTALYGHVKTSGMNFNVGQHVDVSSPTVLTYLGNGFSAQTSGERKHLHFGIYKGQDLYFHGHEATKTVLDSRWYDPLSYLKNKGAESLDVKVSPLVTPVPVVSSTIEKRNFLADLISKIRKLFNR